MGSWLLTYYPPFLLIFYWVDSSARAARRADPLLRDTFRWSRTRAYSWGFIFAIIALYAASWAYAAVVTVPKSIVSDALTIVGLFPIFGALIIGAVLLPLSARRTGDRTLRSHMSWFGLFVLATFVGDLIAAWTYPNHHVGLGLVTYIALPLGAYFLYRSARALVPLNRIAQTDVG